MPQHKYHSGQIIEAVKRADLGAMPPGRYEIIRPLPPLPDGVNQYRIKALVDGHERIAREDDLTADPAS